MFGYLYKKARFSILIIVSFRRLDLKNEPNTQPLQEKFSFARATGIIHHRQIQTVEEHHEVSKSIQKRILF